MTVLIRADIDEKKPKYITLYGVPFSYKAICNTVPGLHWDSKASGNTWRIGLGWASYLALRSTFPGFLEVGPALAQWLDNEQTSRIGPSLALRELLDYEGMEMLYPHQKAGVGFLWYAKRALLCDEMGLGKTITAISTLMAHYTSGTNPFPCLVVAPNSTKKGWAREIEKVWPGLTVTVVAGTSTQRRKQLATPSHVYIMNWESLRSHSRLSPYGSEPLKKCQECGGRDPKVNEKTCQTHLRELNFMDFNSVIGDEVHKIKEGSSQQTRAFKYATGDADIRIGLTGTPIANNAVDLWSILNWLAPEEFPSKTRYIDRFVEASQDMYGHTTYRGLQPANRQEFFDAVNPRIRRVPKDLVLKDLPPLVYEQWDVEMSPKQKKAYKQMVETMMAELDDGSTLAVTSPLTKTTRLLQFASSYAESEVVWEVNKETGEYEPKTKVTLVNPSNKVDAFMNEIDSFGQDQVVVFAASKQLINLLSEKMEKANIRHGLITGDIDIDERQHYMDLFQDGKLQFMLCTTGAGGTGITLTAANTAVFLQRPWSMIESQQAEARVRRIGSQHHDSITIIDLVSPGTIDELVIQAILTKSDRLQEILRDKEMFQKMLEGEI